MTLPPDLHAGDERVPYVACLLTFFVLLQAVAGGRDPVTVLVCAGAYFAGAFLIQESPWTVRVANAAAFTAILASLGFVLGLAFRP